MDYYVDWNCHLLPGMREWIVDPQETLDTLNLLSSRFGMTHFCMMPDYDCTREPVSVFLLRRFRSQEHLNAILPNAFKVKYAARVLFTPGLHQTEELENLLITKDNYLPIRLPICEYADWIDFEINRLLYKRHFRLLFTSFELYPILYSDEAIKKLLRIPNSAYQLNFKSLTDPKIRRIISELIRQNQTVLLGTNLDSIDRAYQYDFEYYTKTAMDTMSIAEYQTMLRKNRYFWNK